jgi:RNase H-fold protein (predicted Holliday junction resolvase)
LDEIVLAVDPGRDKAGMAVVSNAHGTLYRCVVSADDCASRGRELAAAHGVHRIVVGDRTGSREVVRALALSSGLDVITVDEHRSSMEGRQRYLRDHRGKGLSRFVPIGLRTPPEPFDDYVAEILAARYFERERKEKESTP